MSSLSIPAATLIADIQSQLRDREDLYFRLKGMRIDPATGMNIFDFDNAIDVPPPGATDFLSLRVFADPPDDNDPNNYRNQFIEFGGQIVAEGAMNANGQQVHAIAYRGPAPELPASHAESFETPPNEVPDHVKALFAPGGQLEGIPWDKAEVVPMPLNGMKNRHVLAFRDPQTQKVAAFVMMTDADIDTDGPGGSRAIDPYWGKDTKLNYPGGRSCDSRKFPGIVRSIHLLRKPLGLQMGDFAYICYKGRVVACQVYDQGPDDKIGEISLYAAYEVGGLSRDISEHEAAVRGNFADRYQDLVTICFPGSSKDNRASLLPDIAKNTKSAFDAFVAAAAGFAPVNPPPPVQPVQPAPGGGGGAGGNGSFTLYQRATWGALHPKVAAFPLGAAQGIVIHNTESKTRTPAAALVDEVKAAFALSLRIQKDHMFSRGWSDVGQHFTISRGGVIMEARAGTLDAAQNKQVVRGAHAGVGRYNQHWWGIELEGDYTKAGADPTPEQTLAVKLLCSWLGSLIPGFDANTCVVGHRQAHPGGTDCPGHLLDDVHVPHQTDFIDTLRAYLRVSPVAAITIQ